MKFSISKKIYLIVAGIIVLTASISMLQSVSSIRKAGRLEIESLKQTIYKEKKEKIANLIETVYGLLNATDDPEKAKQIIGQLRYGNDGKGYFWINDMQPKMIMHPFKPQLNGKDVSGVRDPKGKYLFMEMVKVCRENKSGVVEYMWSIPGSDIPVPKLSFVKHYAKWDWIIGTGIYINDIDKLIAEKRMMTDKNVKHMLVQTVLLFIVIAGLLLGLTYLAVTRTIITPLNRIIASFEDMAYGEGDLTIELPVESINCSKIKNCAEKDCICYRKDAKCWEEAGSFSSDIQCPAILSGRLKSCKECNIYQQVIYDEISSLSTFFNIFVRKLRSTLQSVNDKSVLSSSSVETMDTLSGEMNYETLTIQNRVSTINSQTENMSGNLNAIAASSEEASININQVAAAAEEMSATINEIAVNSEKASTTTGDAVIKVRGASENVNELGEAASKISRMTETITEISKQTNLLALNATIEAARAGEAGKGFAVVANEIKVLAKQTADATMEIKQQVKDIQQSTNATVTEITQISEVITDVNDIVSTIATAVEEQSITTREITANIAQASSGIKDVNENISGTSTTAATISTEIEEINSSIGSIAENSSRINQNASKLSSAMDQLKENVDKFKIS